LAGGAQRIGQVYQAPSDGHVLGPLQVSLGQIGYHLRYVLLLQLGQSGLGLVQVPIKGVGGGHQNNVLILMLFLQINWIRVVVFDWPNTPPNQEAQAYSKGHPGAEQH
jgi:hypothetical protein